MIPLHKEEVKIILPPDNLVINYLISNAKKSILLSRQALPNINLCNDIIAAKNRGVKIKMLLSSPSYFKKLSVDEITKRFNISKKIVLYTQATVPEKEQFVFLLKENGIDIRYIDHKKYLLNHSKYLIVDSSLAYIGSAPNEAKDRLDIGIITNCQNQIRTIKQLFKIDFYRMHKSKLNYYSSDIIIAPHNMRYKVEQLIDSVKNSLDMLFPLITNDNRILEILKEKIRSGITVRAICSPKMFSLDGSIPDLSCLIELIQIGVKLKFSYNPPIHCRVIILDSESSDHKKVYIGSGHLNTHCFDSNREVAVVTSQSSIILQTADLFENLWNNAQEALLCNLL